MRLRQAMDNPLMNLGTVNKIYNVGTVLKLMVHFQTAVASKAHAVTDFPIAVLAIVIIAFHFSGPSVMLIAACSITT